MNFSKNLENEHFLGGKMHISKLIAVLLLFSSQLALALPISMEERLSDFDQLNAGIKASYGPLQYKVEKQGLQFEKLQENYRAQLLQTKTNADFYYLIRKYISEFHDGHFFAIVPSERMAFFPATVELVDGKILIDQISPMLPPPMFPFKKGDEIISMNGKPIADEINELASYLGNGSELTEKRKAAWMLFSRMGAFVPVPSGSFSLSVRKQGEVLPQNVVMQWMVMGDFIDEMDSLESEPILSEVPQLAAQPIDYLKLSDRETYEMMLGKERMESSYKCSGATRINIPTDAQMITEKPFVSYIHNTPKGKVGYLRLPHYAPKGKDARSAMDQYFSQYEYAIREMERNTVGLVIDQDHNCGGYVNLVERMTSLFIDKPQKPMQFQLLASKAEYLTYRSWLKFFDTFTIMKEELSNVEGLLKQAWQSGTAMTSKTSLLGNDKVYPNRIRYTKPIVITIDEMSGSGGDAFPALMKGYGRAKLVGTRTAGMGGHIGRLPSLNFSQISIQVTKSLFYRPDGVAVENNGATPNYPYTHTVADFVGGYQDYQKFYLDKLLEEL